MDEVRRREYRKDEGTVIGRGRTDIGIYDVRLYPFSFPLWAGLPALALALLTGMIILETVHREKQ